MILIYEGVDISEDVVVNKCVNDMRIDGFPDAVRLVLADDGTWDAWFPRFGERFVARNGQADSGLMHIHAVEPGSGVYVLRASSVPLDMEQTARSGTWEDVTLSLLAQEIAARNGLQYVPQPFEDRCYDLVVQEHQPDLAFLRHRCLLEGLSFVVLDQRLVLFDLARIEAQEPACIIGAGDSDARYALTEDAAGSYGACEVSNGAIVGKAQSATGPAHRTLYVSLYERIASIGEANRYAENLLADANRRARRGVIWSDTLQDGLAAGSVIHLNAPYARSWTGKALVWRIRHDYILERSKLFVRPI